MRLAYLVAGIYRAIRYFSQNILAGCQLFWPAMLAPVQEEQRLAAHFLQEADRISVRRGCGLLMQSRMVYHRQSQRDGRAITLRIREIAETLIWLSAYSYPAAAGKLAC